MRTRPLTALVVTAAAGIDLDDALIETLPEGAGLRFTWKLASMPAQVPPEGRRDHTELFVRACEGVVCSYQTLPLG